MSKNKTHYRKVFKSDHLGAADLEEFLEAKKPLIFTIKEVKQEYGTKVAGKSIDANIAYFKEDIKPLVLNATNSKMVSKIAGSKFVEDWTGITIELYIDHNVKMRGEIVGGVRVKEGKLDWKELEELYELKKESLSDELQVNAERIIKEKESNSYNKLYEHLAKI